MCGYTREKVIGEMGSGREILVSDMMTERLTLRDPQFLWIKKWKYEHENAGWASGFGDEILICHSAAHKRAAKERGHLNANLSKAEIQGRGERKEPAPLESLVTLLSFDGCSHALVFVDAVISRSVGQLLPVLSAPLYRDVYFYRPLPRPVYISLIGFDSDW